jgi:aerobic-type carbon monoxide dehydrogenase small subunit (CoxS/CutS family)
VNGQNRVAIPEGAPSDAAGERHRLRFVLNGHAVDVPAAPNETLLAVLRDALGATEVKYGCGEGVCGTCTVLLDGAPMNACLILGVQVQGRAVTTVRGLPRENGLHPLQRAFVEHEAAQCGFCTPGMLLVAYAFLRDHPQATRDQIRTALSGNLCRCTGYTRIVDAVEACARVPDRRAQAGERP